MTRTTGNRGRATENGDGVPFLMEVFMMWLCWIPVGVCAFNVLFFGTLAVIHLIERRREKNK